MKAIFCEDCGDIVAPYERARRPRTCACGAHAVWWEDPASGVIRVAYVGGHLRIYEELKGKPVGSPRVWILGIANSLLHYAGAGTPPTEAVNRLLDLIGDGYVFKRTRSLIIRVRPGQTGDSDWGYIPRDKWPSVQQLEDQQEAAYLRGYEDAMHGVLLPEKEKLPDGT